ncbi:hypothetical protein VdG1_07196 [Verticillium dahliae VDG1]|nr:hypothetical protein VdG1_07196 [Verticillium dahliae VDG1]
MSSSAPLTTLSLPSLERIASVKVRDLFALPDDPTSLLFVATDRISAYDFVRDWLVSRGLKGVDGVAVPDDVAARTADKYREIFEKLTGEPFEAAVARVGAA